VLGYLLPIGDCRLPIARPSPYLSKCGWVERLWAGGAWCDARETGLEIIMKYLLMIYGNEAAMAAASKADAEKVTGAYMAYT
jgi:hypothetical protein